MQRACALALLHKGITCITHAGNSNDELAALTVIQQLGAVVSHEPGKLFIKSAGVIPVSNFISCGESGLSVRMFTPIAALSSTSININGEGTVLKRPMYFFEEVLPQLSVTVKTNHGFLPLQVKGPLQVKDIKIDGSDSSQYLTGLLMAFAYSNKKASIEVKNLKSSPYIDLTLQMMEHFGYTVKNENYEKFEVGAMQQKAGEEIHYTVEGDWSNAAFLLVAGAIAGSVKLKNLNLNSAQADKKILNALELAGANMAITENEVQVTQSSLRPFNFNATDCPDLFPPLVALAAYCKGKSVIEGCERLQHKESNRALTLQQEFSKFGVSISLQDNKMIIEGTNQLTPASTFSHHDHRIAMACAIAALGAKDTVEIEYADAVNKSFPEFFQYLQQAGVKIEYIKQV